jgi:hypothetical protein
VVSSTGIACRICDKICVASAASVARRRQAHRTYYQIDRAPTGSGPVMALPALAMLPTH